MLSIQTEVAGDSSLCSMGTLLVVHPFLISCTGQSVGQGLASKELGRCFISLTYFSRLPDEPSAYTWQQLLPSSLKVIESLFSTSCEKGIASKLQ